MRAITSLKLSRSICMNLRSFIGLQRLGGVAGEIAQHADDEGQLLLADRPFRFHLVGDVYARLAHALQLVVDTVVRHSRRPPS